MSQAELARRLCEACQQKDEEQIKNLLKLGGDPCFIIPEHAEAISALHSVCKFGDLKILKVLVETSKQINLCVKDGRKGLTPLHYACLYGHLDICTYLINQKCDPHTLTNDGDTVLHMACRCPYHRANCLEIVKLLVRVAKCNVNARNKNGNTPLMVLLKQKEREEILGTIMYFITEMYSNPDEDGNSPLHVACFVKDLNLAKIIAGMKCNPNLTNNNGDTPLHIACRSGSADLAEFLLDTNCNVNIENKSGDTALNIVCRGMNFLLLRLFQKKQIKSSFGESPFFLACKSGNIKMITLLLKLNWDSSEENNDGISPIQTAFQYGHLEIVKCIVASFDLQKYISEILLLLKGGYNPSPMLGELKSTQSLLHVVCGKTGHLSVLKYLMKNATDFCKLIDNRGWTALHYSCYYGHIDIMKHLVDQQLCSPLAQNALYQTPLHLACITACDNQEVALEMVVFLTTNTHADCNALTMEGYSPLMLLINRGKDHWNNIVRYLIFQCYCDLSLKNGIGETALHIACTIGNVYAVEMIIDKKFNPNVKDNAGNMPIDIACKNGHTPIIAQILRSKHCGIATIIDLFRNNSSPVIVPVLAESMDAKRDDDGNAPIHVICINNDIKLAKLAADMRCNPNVVNKVGDAPLHIVCRSGNVSIAAILLSIQLCDINLKNNDGDTPLHLACRKNLTKIVEMLMKRNPDTEVMNVHGRTQIYEAFHTSIKLGWLLSTEHNEKGAKLNLAIIQQLIIDGFPPTEFFKSGFTNSRNILHVLCGEMGDIDALKFFAQYADCLMHKDDSRWTPLHYACSNGHLSIVQYLVTQPDYYLLTSIQSNKGETPLHVSCNPHCTEERALAVIKVLTTNSKTSCNVRDYDGNTPIMYLLYHKPSMIAIAQYLIEECQCDLSIKNNNGNTACHISCIFGYSDFVYLLIKAGSNFCIKNNKMNTPLHLACKLGYVDIVTILLNLCNCGLYEQNIASFTPIQVAEKNNHSKIISLLIYAMYDSLGEERNTPLHIACKARNIHLAQMIVDMNFNSTAANKFGDTPLHLACRNGSLQLVNLLTKHAGCDFDYRNELGDTPLHAACESGNLAVVYMLLKKCDFPSRKNNAGLSPFYVALQCNKLEVAYLLANDTEAVQLLAMHGMGNVKDISGWTPLHYACYYGRPHIVTHLLNDVECDPNAKTENGITPLQLACYSDSSNDVVLKIVTSLTTEANCNPDASIYSSDTLLIHLLKTNNKRYNILLYLITRYGCDLSITDSAGNTALHVACGKTSNYDIVKVMISKNDYVARTMNHDGNTPLHIACINEHTVMVQMLLATHKCGLYLQNNAECTPLECAKMSHNQGIMLLLIRQMFVFRDINGNTPLHSACINQDLVLAKLILNNKFNVSVKNDSDDTPLHLACRYGLFEVFKTLMEANGDLFAKNKDGNTPLSLACMRSHHKIVEILINANCGLRSRNKDGDGPLHHACRSGYLPVIKLIIEKGGLGLIKEQNVKGYTPLHLSFQNNHLNVATFLIFALARRAGEVVPCANHLLAEVKQLVKDGLDPYQLLRIHIDNVQQTFLHAACKHQGDIEAVQLLTTSANSSADVLDAASWAPLHYACVHGHVDIVSHLILRAGSNPNITTPVGSSPLLLLCTNSVCSEDNALKLVKFFTATIKCDPNDTIFNGDTLLIYLLKLQKFRIIILHYLILEYQCCLLTKSQDGNTALHIARDKKTATPYVVKLISNRGHHYASVKNNKQETPLHVACRSGTEGIVLILLSCYGEASGLYETDKDGNLPLLTAFYSGNRNIASMLISKMYSLRDKNGNTPLHLVTVMEDISLVQFIGKNKCDATAVNNDGDTALHLACRTNNSKLIKAVLNLNRDAQIVSNINGDTPVHVTCRLGNQVLLNLQKSDLTRRELKSLIHVASENNHTHIVTILMDNNIDINVQDKNGDTPLHVVCRGGHISTCILLLMKECDINIQNANGDTPLHLACQSGAWQICEQLLKRDCDINLKNNDGDTPLLIACKYCDFEIIQRLLSKANLDTNEANHAGDTILHVLCRLSFCTSEIVQYILQATQIDPNTANYAGETPIYLTSNPRIIHELIRYGADPKLVYTSSVQLGGKNPPQPSVKVFVVGNSSVGKSTLTAALQKELPRLVKVFVPAKKVSGVDEKTAGIIPHDFDSKRYGHVTMYDFAGHREFYSSHAVLLQSSIESSPPIILLVIDLQESLEDIKQNIQYWLSFLENQSSLRTKKQPHVIIVGSHADILKSNGENLKEREKVVESFFHFESVNIVGFVAMDCQYSESSSMTRLRQYLTDSCKSLRITENIKFNAHCFLVYLIDTYKEVKAVTLDQILQRIGHEKQAVTTDSPLFFLPHNLSILLDLCGELNNRGHILLLKNADIPLNSWVVIDKESLLSDVIGTIFAPEGLKQYSNLASNTGVVPLSKLSNTFSTYNSKMLVGFLTHLEFCHEISDKEILQLIDKHIQESSVKVLGVNDIYLFFPALVRISAPEHVSSIKPQDHYTHHCGWILKCSKLEHFFTSRLLEVLLLRLMFSFALGSDDISIKVKPPILQRKCSVWKNGIFWGNNDGVETLVEVLPSNKAIVVFMRCLDKDAASAYLRLRSRVFQKVLTAVTEFCVKVDIAEYFIDPSQTLSYPISATKLYSMKDISTLIVENSTKSICVVSECGESLPLKAVVTFEPYVLLDQRIIAKMFGSDDAVDEFISDSVLSAISQSVLNNEATIIFANLFEETNTVTNSLNFVQLLVMLKEWRSSCKGTYSCLRQKLDQYSITSGRNLLVSVIEGLRSKV